MRPRTFRQLPLPRQRVTAKVAQNALQAHPWLVPVSLPCGVAETNAQAGAVRLQLMAMLSSALLAPRNLVVGQLLEADATDAQALPIALHSLMVDGLASIGQDPKASAYACASRIAPPMTTASPATDLAIRLKSRKLPEEPFRRRSR